MDRYVNASAVRAAIVKAREAALEHKPYGWEWENNGYNGAILAAGRVPAADVRPVKRGEWVKVGDVHDRETGQEFPVFCCSKCGAINYIGNHYFCYFCGADMRPEEDNHEDHD